MTTKPARLRKALSILFGAAALAAIFAAAALLGALVANATSPAIAAERAAPAFEGVSYKENCWGRSTSVDDFGDAFSRSVSVCD